MWDFEAELSQTVLDQNSDEENNIQINHPRNLRGFSRSNAEYR